MTDPQRSKRKRTLDKLISDTKRELRLLQRREGTEEEPTTLARVRKNLCIKSAFLTKLIAEQTDAPRR